METRRVSTVEQRRKSDEVASMREPRPGQASGDRLHVSGVQAPGEEGLAGESPVSHNVVVEQPVVSQKRNTWCNEGVPKKSQAIFQLSQNGQETKHKQANWQAHCFFLLMFLNIRIVKSVNSQRLPGLCAETTLDARGDGGIL